MSINPRHGGCVLLAAPLLLASCTGAMPQAVPDRPDSAGGTPSRARTFAYDCEGGTQLTVRLETARARLFLPDGTQVLRQTAAGPQPRYSNGSASYRLDGENASLEIGERAYRGCRNDRARAIWEDAKLRGVDYRAVGNEPGWYLEIGEHILLVTGYGQHSYRFVTPPVRSDASSAATVYQVQEGKHSLHVSLSGQPCQDTMSGAAFPTTVLVTIDGRRLSGCGRALH